MRKTIALVLSTCFLLAQPVSAADLDLSGYSIEDLLELRKQITAELSEKGYAEKVVIPNGLYTVGTDIKAGRYVMSGDGKGNGVSAYIYENQAAYEDRDKITIYAEDDEEELIDLSDGQLVYFDGIGTSVYIEDATKTDAFWAP